MKQPKHNFNLEAEPNNAGEHLIFFNLSYGAREYIASKQTINYTPLRISTQWSIKKEYWNDRPTYRANQTYVKKFGKDLNNVLDKIERISYEQLSNYRNINEEDPTTEELKQLVFEKLKRIPKIENDIAITNYIDAQVTERTTVNITSSKSQSERL